MVKISSGQSSQRKATVDEKTLEPECASLLLCEEGPSFGKTLEAERVPSMLSEGSSFDSIQAPPPRVDSDTSFKLASAFAAVVAAWSNSVRKPSAS